MKIGVVIFPTDYAIPITELARACEAAGLDSLFVAEHTHIPASRLTPWPGGAALPQQYWHTLDPFVALSAAAAVTSRLKLGTGISLVVEHDPIVLAKQVASLDHLSGGRFLFGVGGGWNREEMENHGTTYETRWSLLRERIEAMKVIWTMDQAEYHGRFVDFGPIWSWPKPIQRPHPPILVGGDAPNTFKRVLGYGDVWMPIPGRGAADLAERMAELKRLATEAGRGRIPVWVYGVSPRPESMARYRELGIDAAIVALPDADAETVLPIVEALGSEVARLT
ncbi:MAG TPA: LLM class F420-dependent oxidoreductase [Candidatus Dormibacteraeota bacterium]|nr:LLM class F420-dependent oxidoreductase [Candidatus Dormibacteraeota bacterium]